MMWGEIEPCPASSPVCGLLLSSCETVLHSPGLVPEAKKYDYSTDAKEQQGDNESVCPSELSSMIEAVAASKSPVKSQQLGDPDLTLEERRQVLLEQYRAKPLVFLERYAAHLRPEHLAAFAHLGDDCRAQHYCREVQRRATSRAAHTRVRNKRYAALRALQQEGQYFSEEQMRVREPLLYEQYIGQYLSEEELCQRAAQSMSAGCTGLADLLMNSYQERLLQNTLQQQQDREEEAQEETEEEEEECCEEGGGEHWEPSEEEKALLKEEFLTQMHQRFLDGKDKGFNYSEVDENPDYDNLDIVSRDAEERYFDDDDDDDDDDEEEEGEVEEEEEEEDDEEMQ